MATALTPERIKKIGQTLGKEIPGVSNYRAWPGMGYEKDANGQYTVPSFPDIGYEFARSIELEILKNLTKG